MNRIIIIIIKGLLPSAMFINSVSQQQSARSHRDEGLRLAPILFLTMVVLTFVSKCFSSGKGFKKNCPYLRL